MIRWRTAFEHVKAPLIDYAKGFRFDLGNGDGRNPLAVRHLHRTVRPRHVPRSRHLLVRPRWAV